MNDLNFNIRKVLDYCDLYGIEQLEEDVINKTPTDEFNALTTYVKELLVEEIEIDNLKRPFKFIIHL